MSSLHDKLVTKYFIRSLNAFDIAEKVRERSPECISLKTKPIFDHKRWYGITFQSIFKNNSNRSRLRGDGQSNACRKAVIKQITNLNFHLEVARNALAVQIFEETLPWFHKQTSPGTEVRNYQKSNILRIYAFILIL